MKPNQKELDEMKAEYAKICSLIGPPPPGIKEKIEAILSGEKIDIEDGLELETLLKMGPALAIAGKPKTATVIKSKNGFIVKYNNDLYNAKSHCDLRDVFEEIFPGEK